VHPDLCVALGAGLLASRLQGHDVDRVLVDISPYSFGPSYLGVMDGRQYLHCYHPIIKRNTPLPVTRTDSYSTSVPFQKAVHLEIFQGENPDALKNILVGDFTVEGLTLIREENEVLCRMSLDLDGILKVEAIEKRTGLSKHITIRNATESKSDADLARAKERLERLHETRSSADASDSNIVEAQFEESENAAPQQNPELSIRIVEAESLLKRSRSLLDTVHNEDKEEIVDIHEKINEAIEGSNIESLSSGIDSLKELLFFIEGK